jgi:hypothetical protein
VSITVLTSGGRHQLEGRSDGDDLWMSPADLEAISGWSLKPEGFCRDEVCVPVPAGAESSFVAGADVNAARLWRHLGHPAVHTADGSHWYLGEGAAVRRAQLEGLEAPDFTLPDLDGRMHSLSDHRGKKVFLATWASW